MQGNKIKKRPLKPSKKPLTSTSSSQSATARGDLAFSVEQKKSKVTTFNPLLTTSLLFDPKALERRQKTLVQR